MRWAAKRTIIIFLLFGALPQTARADSSSDSIYHVDPAVDGPVIGVTALGAWLPYVFESKLITPKCPCDSGSVNSLDRGAIGNNSQTAATISDVTLGLALFVPPIVDLVRVGANSTFVEDLVVYAEALSVSSALTTTAKYTVQRPLPRTYAGDPSLINSPGGYRSFYSGHTAQTFAALSAAAMTAHRRYHAGAWPWLVAVGVGGSVAYERVAAGVHFPTDVMTGALMGALVGTVIPLLHFNSNSGSAAPMVTSQRGFGLTWKMHF